MMKTFSRDTRNLLLVACIAVVGYLLWSGDLQEEPWNVRRAQYFSAIQSARPLIDAIDSYVDRRGVPPDSLDELVSRYLPSLPGTGIPGCRRFKYASFGDDKVFVLWYDLGPLQGRSPAKPGRYSDGDPTHAILAFTIGEGERVVDARLDRIPKGIEGMQFDRQQWLGGARRMEMAVALPDEHRLARMPLDELERLLGTPDGQRTMRETPWELRINCPKGVLEREILIYWPNQNYPQQLNGRNAALMGDWLYVPP